MGLRVIENFASNKPKEETYELFCQNIQKE